MNLKKIKAPLFLLLAALIWGTTFVAQDLASDSVRPFTFNGIRMLLGGLILIPVVTVKNKGKLFATVPSKKDKIFLLLGGMLCGVILFFACFLQQAGIDAGTTAGKSGFITAMYVVLVPLVGIFFKRKTSPAIWLGVAFSTVGLYLLCMADFSAGLSGLLQSLSMSKGDFLTLLCALVFAFHILAVDHFAPNTDGVFLSCVQFLFAGTVGVVAMFLFEQPTWGGILAASGSILYSAVFSCGLAYTFQILGQKDTPPALASILMCLESVFAVLSDAIFLHTAMGTEEILGCFLMFAALLVASLWGNGKKA